jgi:PAS domain S-box-containing protein
VGIRHDIIEAEKYKELLKNKLEDTSTTLKISEKLSQQYETGLNESTAIFRTDTDNIITYVNDNFCHLSGYGRDELVGIKCSTLRDFSHIQNGDCEKLKAKLQNKELIRIKFNNVGKSGNHFYTDTIVYPIEDINENIIEHMHIMHDITEIVELNKEIEDTQKEVVFTMGAIGETRSKETGFHVKRVAEYSCLLAKLAGIDEDEAELIKMASPMHDIGKVGIPDAILNKPGKLTEDEYETMKTHAQIGFDMLKGSKRPILQASAVIALDHHEKWNGRGYPNGKTAEDIHIYGRITAICDVFDALGSDRCYKKAWELDRILTLFKEESGEHFDPNLMKLFLDNLDQFLKIRDMYVD